LSKWKLSTRSVQAADGTRYTLEKGYIERVATCSWNAFKCRLFSIILCQT